MKRRDFLKNTAVIVAGASVSLSALEWIDPKKILAANPQLRWGFLVDTHKCVGCGFCVKACKVENDIPFEANVTRTWVERYVIKTNGDVVMDSPKGARNGFTTKLVDQNASGMTLVPEKDTEGQMMLGYSFRALGDFERAAWRFDLAAKNPELPPSRNSVLAVKMQLGQCYRELGQYKRMYAELAHENFALKDVIDRKL